MHIKLLVVQAKQILSLRENRFAKNHINFLLSLSTFNYSYVLGKIKKIVKRPIQLVCAMIALTWIIRTFKLSIEINLFLQMALKCYIAALHLFIDDIYRTRF